MAPKDEQIAKLFREGKSQRAIARLIGLSQPAIRKRLIKMGLITSKPRSDNSIEQAAMPLTPGNHQGDTPPPTVDDNCTHTDNSSAGKNDNRESQGVITSDTGRGDTPQAPDSGAELPWSGDPVEPQVEDDDLSPILQRGEDSLLRLRVAARSQVGSKLLNEAAEVLLAVINPPLTAFFRDSCQQMGAKSWQVVCALVHRSCGLRQLDYYKDPEEKEQAVLCRNCGHDIPGARPGQLYCCGRCAAYHQGSRVIPFGVHSEECPIKGQPWQREVR